MLVIDFINSLTASYPGLQFSYLRDGLPFQVDPNENLSSSPSPNNEISSSGDLNNAQANAHALTCEFRFPITVVAPSEHYKVYINVQETRPTTPPPSLITEEEEKDRKMEKIFACDIASFPPLELLLRFPATKDSEGKLKPSFCSKPVFELHSHFLDVQQMNTVVTEIDRIYNAKSVPVPKTFASITLIRSSEGTLEEKKVPPMITLAESEYALALIRESFHLLGTVKLFSLLEAENEMVYSTSSLPLDSRAIIHWNISQEEIQRKSSPSPLLQTSIADSKAITPIPVLLLYKEFGEHTQLSCALCFEVITFKEIFQLECSHCYCKNCLSELCSFYIQRGEIHMLLCPVPSCKLPFSIEVIAKLTDLDTRNRFETISNLRFLDCQDEFIFCGACGNPSFLSSRYDEGNLCILDKSRVVCGTCPYPDCEAVFCLKCMGAMHSSKTCPPNPERPVRKHDVPAVDNNEISRRKAANKLSDEWVKRNTRICPYCKSPIIKTIGCNHMICSVCKGTFCWACGAAISKGYDHFNIGKCTLFYIPPDLEPDVGAHHRQFRMHARRQNVRPRHSVGLYRRKLLCVRRCSKCGFTFEKTTTSNIYTCFNCGIQHCFLCNNTINSLSHFARTSCCQHSPLIDRDLISPRHNNYLITWSPTKGYATKSSENTEDKHYCDGDGDYDYDYDYDEDDIDGYDDYYTEFEREADDAFEVSHNYDARKYRR